MKPMLAATVQDVESLRWPLLASPKLDGVRAIVRGGCVLSRNLKPIPNYRVQELFGKLEGYDGELIVGPPTAKDCYRRTMSGVMSQNTEIAQDVKFMVFDNFWGLTKTFKERLGLVLPAYLLAHHVILNAVHLLEFEERILKEGYEGVMLRDPNGRYKHGRSTLTEGGLMKLKRFVDDEATVTDFEELYSNQNEAKINALGHTERSSHQANQVPMGTLGALVCRWRDKTFKIGTGFTQDDRNIIWFNRETLRGQMVKFKYLEVGMKDLPRHPVYLGWSDK